jgi:LemA protein
MMTGLLIFLLLCVGIAVFAIGQFNGLVALRNQNRNAFSQIDVQLNRRYDLIPNLVEVAKGYMKHERETLEAVIAARNSALAASKAAAADPTNAANVQQLAGAEASLGGTLGRLFALNEQYPDLKANQNMMQLTEELTSTENKIAFARQAYNDTAMVYNTACETFPGNFVAAMFAFKSAFMWQIEDPAHREAVSVKF